MEVEAKRDRPEVGVVSSSNGGASTNFEVEADEEVKVERGGKGVSSTDCRIVELEVGYMVKIRITPMS